MTLDFSNEIKDYFRIIINRADVVAVAGGRGALKLISQIREIHPNKRFYCLVDDGLSDEAVFSGRDVARIISWRYLNQLLKVEDIRAVIVDVTGSGLTVNGLNSNDSHYIGFYYVNLDSSIHARGVEGKLRELGVDGDVYVKGARFSRLLPTLEVKKDPVIPPLVSVVVPAYNVEKYIEQCVRSLASQGPDIEVLVVDDASTDDTNAIVAQLCMELHNVKLLSKPNGGCASARNFGLSNASGEYVAFVDGDDWVSSGMYRELLASARRFNSDIVISRFYKYYSDSDSEEVSIEHVQCSEGDFSGDVIDIMQLTQLQPAIWRNIYRRSFLVEYGLRFDESLRRFDDLAFAFETYAKSRSVACVPSAYYMYRLGRPGQDVAVSDDRLFVHFDIFKRLKDFVRRDGGCRTELLLKNIELAAHGWALRQISKKWKIKYFRYAVSSFREVVYANSWQVFKLTRGRKWSSKVFIMLALMCGLVTVK